MKSRNSQPTCYIRYFCYQICTQDSLLSYVYTNVGSLENIKGHIKKKCKQPSNSTKKIRGSKCNTPHAGKGTEDTFKTLGSYVSNDNQCCFLVYES